MGNQLESALIEGTRLAQREYTSMTGWWLSHGPESFLMCAVARTVAKKGGFSVFIEASPKKIRDNRGQISRRRSPVNDGQRFDIVVWQKSSDNIRAIIEVKLAWNISGLRGDRDKISKYMNFNSFINTGYLLAYTEAKGKRRETTLNNRLANWAKELHCNLPHFFVDSNGDGDWGWAAGLLRLND